MVLPQIIMIADIMRVFQDFFRNRVINGNLNETYICLISKKLDARTVADFRPISLTTGLYKIIARVLLERLKKVLPFTITGQQTTFVEGRQILDASLMANDLIDEWERKKQKGVVIKLDMEKAFDKVDWTFLKNILVAKGFGPKWRRWIKGCISSTNFSIIINGRPRGKIYATRGLRQGDPLSPFLFIMVMDCLSRLLTKAEYEGQIKGFQIGNEGLSINHLQFADDTILFSDLVNASSIKNMIETVKTFEGFSR